MPELIANSSNRCSQNLYKFIKEFFRAIPYTFNVLFLGISIKRTEDLREYSNTQDNEDSQTVTDDPRRTLILRKKTKDFKEDPIAEDPE